MKKAIKLNESDIRSLINEILSEDLMPPGFHPSVGDRPIAAPKPKSGLPNLKAFKTDCNMMADAAGKVKAILDAGQGNTKEALRWIDRVIQYATSAKKGLGS